MQSRPAPPTGVLNQLVRASTTAAAASKIALAQPGRLFLLVGYNAKTSAQFIQVHNSATLPSDTSVPIYSFTVPASSNFSLDLGIYGDFFDAGITVCNSSTQATKTIGTTDCWFNVLVL